jgi:hypothetical protein
LPHQVRHSGITTIKAKGGKFNIMRFVMDQIKGDSTEVKPFQYNPFTKKTYVEKHLFRITFLSGKPPSPGINLPQNQPRIAQTNQHIKQLIPKKQKFPRLETEPTENRCTMDIGIRESQISPGSLLSPITSPYLHILVREYMQILSPSVKEKKKKDNH